MEFFTKASREGWQCEQILERTFPVRLNSFHVGQIILLEFLSPCFLTILGRNQSDQQFMVGEWPDKGPNFMVINKHNSALPKHTVHVAMTATDRELTITLVRSEGNPNACPLDAQLILNRGIFFFHFELSADHEHRRTENSKMLVVSEALACLDLARICPRIDAEIRLD